MEPLGLRFINGCIVFNGVKSVFYSGQLLEAMLNFELHSPLDISAIDVVFLGEGSVQWTEEQEEMYGGVKRWKTLNYVGKEVYFNHVIRISQGPTVLQAGAHSIHFSYQIPYTSPSSFKSEKGQVKYTVTAYIILQDGVTKDKIEAEFSVIDPLNLNTGSPDIKNPLVMEFEQEMSCQCFWSSKPLGITVRLPAQGMCPGEVVPIMAEVRNNTTAEINKLIFQITTRERYRSLQPQSEYEPPEGVVLCVKKGPILSNTSKDYQFEFTVPDFIAPNMEHCNLIDIGYFFKVQIKLSGCNEDMEDEAEICIGLVPLGGSTDLSHHPMADKLPNGPIPNRPDNVPPAYEPYAPQQNNMQTNAQLYAPGAIPYPVTGNEGPYGSKTSLTGPVEIGFRATGLNTSVNPALPQPVPNYPYPGVPQGQTPYPIQPSAPSAPPPY